MTGPVYAKQTLLNLVTAAVAATAEFDGCKIGLVEDVTPIAPGTLLADVHLATYDGYANSAAVAWQTPHIDGDGKGIVQCLPKEFKPTGSTTTSTVRQVILVNSAGTAIKASYMLDTPIVFGSPSDVHLIGFPIILMQPTADLEQIVP